MSITRTISALAALVTMAMLVTACGGDDESPAAGTSATHSLPAQTGDETAAPGAEDTGGATEETEGTPQAEETAQPVPVPAHLEFEGETVDGAAFSGASLAGKDAVLYFWAPWCPVCRAEMPDIADTMAGFEDEVSFVGVASLGDIGQMEDFIADTGSGAFPHVADFDGVVWSIYEVTYQYTFAFLNDDGTYETFQGRLSANELADRVEALIEA